MHIGEPGTELPPASERLHATHPCLPVWQSPGEGIGQQPAKPQAKEHCRYQIFERECEELGVLEDPERERGTFEAFVGSGLRLQCLRLGA